MGFLKVIKKVFTTPVYLFGEDKQKTEEQEEQELFAEDQKEEVRWYDKVFSWPMFIVTWLAEIVIIFFRPTNSIGFDLAQLNKPRKLKTAATPLLQFLAFLIRLVIVMVLLASLFIGVIVLIGWIFTHYSKF